MTQFPPASAADAPDARLLAHSAPGDNAPPVSVSQLSAALKRTVEDGFGRVRVRGELSGVKRAASGHVYGAMKDENALIDLVMWKGAAGRMAFVPEDGLDVIATGRLTTFPGRSKYQLVADTLELAGEGALMLLFERLKARLRAEGLFDRPRQPLPMLPRVIGVVTSPTGAVIRDILHRLADRCPAHVLLWPVAVQGEAAAGQIAAAVRGFAAIAPGGPVPRPDVVIVARGGGSIEDLWAFNEEVVVRAIADCAIPTISAVGHETDVTLADHAADWRAPTPTAAAEMAVPVRRELLAGLADCHARLLGAAERALSLRRERTAGLAMRLPRRDALYAPQRQRLDDAAARLDAAPRQRLVRLRQAFDLRAGALRPALLRQRLAWDQRRLAAAAAALDPARAMQRVARGRSGLDALVRLLGSLDPRVLLGRGYAMVRRPDGALVTSARQARASGALVLAFADGEVAAAVADVRPARAAPPKRPPPAGPQTDLFGD